MIQKHHAHADIAQVMDYYDSVGRPGMWPDLDEFDPMSADIPWGVVD